MAKIRDMFRLRKTAGQVGIEIEMEGKRLPDEIVKWWRVEGDGSLRGQGYEYVTVPLAVNEVEPALDLLWSQFNYSKCQLKPSDRCGVHVHLNMQEWSFKQTMTFICLYMVLEDVLVRWCGEDREGNLFCLRGRDAEYIYDILLEAQRGGTFKGLRGMGGDMRYSSINLNALSKYGSLEFRALRTPKDYNIVQKWVEMLLQIRDSSKDFSVPHAIVEGVSMEGAEVFLDMVMGKYARDLMCPDIHMMLMDGVRRVQEIAYEELQVNEEMPNDIPAGMMAPRPGRDRPRLDAMPGNRGVREAPVWVMDEAPEFVPDWDDEDDDEEDEDF